MSLECIYCPAPATSGVDSIDRKEYAQVCDYDLARIIRDFDDMIQVPLIAQPEYYWEDCECGCQ